jgi:hypothetical protein
MKTMKGPGIFLAQFIGAQRRLTRWTGWRVGGRGL